ncbi:MAG: hypothetical protein SangKO_011000 [Sandaracinaceae bacterium]
MAKHRNVGGVLERMQEVALRPAYISALGGASVEQLIELERYGYFLLNPASTGRGRFCTMPVPGTERNFCLFAKGHGPID